MSKTTANYKTNAMKSPKVKIVRWSVVSIMILAVHSFANLGNLVNRCDVNRDGVINIQDIVLVSNHMGEKSDYSELIEEVIPEVTFDNVLTLLPGEKYKLRFSDYKITFDEFGEPLVTHIYWGSVNGGELVKGFTIDDPKIGVAFFIYPHIYYKTLDGERVFECEDITDEKLLCDEVIIIVERTSQGVERTSQDTGSSRDNRFTYTDILYHTTVIGNLTHPDRTFREYE